VREVLGAPSDALSDDEAIRMVLDPSRNPYLGESLTLGTHSKVMRALHHPGYTFQKKLSHTADSQDQRHRMTPASRPILLAHLSDEPDVITPPLVSMDEVSHRTYRDVMDRTWDAFNRLRKMGVSDEFAAYLLPNATAIRFTESADLLHLHHKLTMRLCFNAQEEIWRASLDEAIQIRDINPRIGQYLLPPCGLRSMAPKKPYCPEGDRYCGVPVWNQDLPEYTRII
ncbi:MAG: FAD-dependent thymidylate synthase, partial [Planctomycetota bacterium]|nr:FAD-dependent thymidylate synthase [Planctomycetota bacterium]